jgi:glycosyltransferase involved in cell wall biosynthesis
MTSLPSGGLKVQYQNATGLAARGHTVTVMHPMSEFRMIGVRGTARYANLLLEHRRLGHGVVRWFRLDPRVRLRLLPFVTGWLLPRADVTVLTAWQTAEWTTRPRRAAGRMVQVAYDYEFWMSGNEQFKARVARAFSRDDVTLFSPSAAVTGMLREIGREPVALTPPGIDHDLFGCDLVPEARGPVVGFAVRNDPVKAMPVMMEACELIHRSRPEVTICCYGHYDGRLPEHVQRAGALSEAELRAFYNRCQVFVVPSDYEGWGLPGVEAMACGAALVTTANGGSAEFAVDGENSLVVPPRDPGAITHAVLRLMDADDLRSRVAHAGIRTAADISVPGAAAALERAIMSRQGPLEATQPGRPSGGSRGPGGRALRFRSRGQQNRRPPSLRDDQVPT